MIHPKLIHSRKDAKIINMINQQPKSVRVVDFLKLTGGLILLVITISIINNILK